MRFAKLLLATALVLAATLTAQAQAAGASVRMAGQVSAAVAVSVAPGMEVKAGEVQADSRQVNLQTAVVTLSGAGGAVAKLLVPVRIRSNTAYVLSASMKSNGVSLASLSVTSPRATGRFVAAGAVDSIKMTERMDFRKQTLQSSEHNAGLLLPSHYAPIALLTGASISTAGTLSSPDNAIEVTLTLIIEPPSSRQRWEMEVVLTAAAH